MTDPGLGDPAGAGEFRLDVAKAEEAVRALVDVRLRIRAAREQAVRLAQTPRTADDAVSAEAFTLLAQKADGGPGSFTAAMDAGLIHVDGLIDQMQADIARQRDLDATVAGFVDRA